MLSRLDMAGAFGVAAGFIWCIISISALFLHDTMHLLSSGPALEYLEMAKTVLAALGFFPGLIIFVGGGAFIGWVIPLLNFDFTEL